MISICYACLRVDFVADCGGYGNEVLGFIKGWKIFIQVTVFGSDSVYYVT